MLEWSLVTNFAVVLPTIKVGLSVRTKGELRQGQVRCSNRFLKCLDGLAAVCHWTCADWPPW